MVNKIVKYGKILMALALIASITLPTYATVGAADGSAFVTKAEFDSALSDFNARLTTFEAGINSKIDSQVSSYLDRNGIWNGKTFDCYFKDAWLFSNDMYGSIYPWSLDSDWDNTVWSDVPYFSKKYVKFPGVYEVMDYSTSTSRQMSTASSWANYNQFRVKIEGPSYGGTDFYWCSCPWYDSVKTNSGYFLNMTLAYPLGKIEKSGLFSLSGVFAWASQVATLWTNNTTDWSYGVTLAFVALPKGKNPWTANNHMYIRPAGADGSATKPFTAGESIWLNESTTGCSFYNYSYKVPNLTINSRLWGGYYQQITNTNYIQEPGFDGKFFVEKDQYLWITAFGRGYSFLACGSGSRNPTGLSNVYWSGLCELPIRFIEMRIF